MCSSDLAAAVGGPRIAMKSGPRLPQLEKALAQKRRSNTAINKKKKKKNLLNYFGPVILSILENVPRALEKNVYSAAVGQNVLYVC